jgi:cytochrome c oxidase subunit 1
MAEAQAQAKLREGLRALPRPDKLLLGGSFALAGLALTLGVLFALLVVLEAVGFLDLPPLRAFQFLTLHATTVFYYWLYFVQVGVILALILVYTEGARLTPLGRAAGWVGLLLMAAGWTLNLWAPARGAAVLYSAPEPLAQQFEGAGLFLLGYILLSLGLIVTAAVGLVTAIRPKWEGRITEWSSISYAAFLWEGLLAVSSVIALFTYVPALQQILGLPPIFQNFNYTMSWAVLFHNMHYLPLMSTVLVWYVLSEATTGVKSIFGERLSKTIFSLYLIFVPPTSLYHLFLEPGVAPGIKLLGSMLALFISVPTIAVFLLIVASLQACAHGQGARGLFGWLHRLPWRNPSFAAIGMAAVCALGGGAIANVLIQERFAPLLSDTFAVPGYFHFFTAGTVTLTFLGALMYMIPALRGRRLPGLGLAVRLPYAQTIGVYLFGIAGVWAGYLGMPRRALEFDYGGLAPSTWKSLMAIVGIGGLLMVIVLLSYVILLGAAALGSVRRERRPEEWATATFRAEDAQGQPAWFGPVGVGLLLVAMSVATVGAFQLMQRLPLGR